MKKISLFAILGLLIHLSTAKYSMSQTPYAQRVWEKLPLLEYIGYKGMYTLDIDGDGKNEILASSRPEVSYYFTFYILTIDSNDYTIKWSSKPYRNFFSHGLVKIKPYNFDGDNDYEIYVLDADGVLECYDGQTMDLLYQTETNAEEADDFLIEDIDNDGELELIISFDDYGDEMYINVYNEDFTTLEWSTADYGSNEIEIGDVDNDNVKEIILNNGYIIDGITHQIDWDYGIVFGNEFGRRIEVEDIDQNGVPEIIGATNDSIIAYNAQTNEKIWSFAYDHSPDAFYVGNIDEDSDIELVVGCDQFGGIECYSATTQSLDWAMDLPMSVHGISNLCFGDADNDGEMEIAFGSGHSFSGPDKLFVANLESLQIEWQSMDYKGNFSFDIGNIDNTNNNELVIAAKETSDYYNGGRVLVYDGVDHHLKMITEDTFTVYSSIECVEIANTNASPQKEILTGFEYQGYQKLKILDGLSYETIFEGLGDKSIYDIAVADIDKDNTVEIIVGQSQGIVLILNHENYTIEDTLANIWGRIKEIAVNDYDNDWTNEIIFLGQNDSIFIYDGLTKQLEHKIGPVYEQISSFAISDLDNNGVKELLIAENNGYFRALKCNTMEVITEQFLLEEPIYNIKACNIDDSPGQEIIVGSTKLSVFAGGDYSLIWESRQMLLDDYLYNDRQIIRFNDIDANQRMDIFYSNARGIFQFEVSSNYPFAIEKNSHEQSRHSIYPNPVQGKINIESANTIEQVQVYNIHGSLVKSQVVNKHTCSINCEMLSNGLYFVKVKTNKEEFIQKVIKGAN